MGDEDAKDVLEFWRAVGASVVEERIAVIVCGGAEMVGVFLGVLAFEEEGCEEGDYHCDADGLRVEVHGVA